MTLEKIPLTNEEHGVIKHEGITLNKIEKACALKINEIVDAVNNSR